MDKRFYPQKTVKTEYKTVEGYDIYLGIKDEGKDTEQREYCCLAPITTQTYHEEFVPKSLSSVTVTRSTQNFNKTFDCCSNLKEVHIKSFTDTEGNIAGPTTIYTYAFRNCENLTRVTLPKTLNLISNYAFENCKELRSIVFEGTMDEWSAINKPHNWHFNGPESWVVTCSDGDVPYLPAGAATA